MIEFNGTIRGNCKAAPFRLIEPCGVTRVTARLAIMSFRPDIAACDIECPVHRGKFAAPDPAIGADSAVHPADVALLVHQHSHLGARKTAVAPARLNSRHLPVLARIDLLSKDCRLGCSAVAVAVAFPAGLRRGRGQPAEAECENAEGFFIMLFFMFFVPFKFGSAAVRLRRRTTEQYERCVSVLLSRGKDR